MITYNLYESGLPKAKHYALWNLNLGLKPRQLTDAYLNDNGKVVNVLADVNRHVAEDPIDLVVFGGKGEPFQFAIISSDGQFRAFTEIVPFPIEQTEGPCHLSAIEAGPNYSGVIMRLTGLQPNEELQINSQSDKQSAQSKSKADDQGRYNTVFFPIIKGMRSGIARFSLVSNSCKVHLEFPWGEGSYQFQ